MNYDKTQKPHCNNCGCLMVKLYYKESEKDSGNKSNRKLIPLWNRWYCKSCGKILKEE